MKSEWWTGNVPIRSLEMDLSRITEIENCAFRASAFETIYKLILVNMKLKKFNSDTFTGLTSLKSLKLLSIGTSNFPYGFLNGISNSLKYFLLSGPYTPISVNIDGLFGGINMAELIWIKVYQNLSDTITSSTFTGLSKIKIIDLSDCLIRKIGMGAFDSVRLTLKSLRLERNRLTTLPAGFFVNILPNFNLIIYLSDNPWHCACNLNDLKWHVQQYIVSFVEIPQCFTPTYMTNTGIIHAQLMCDPETTPAPIPNENDLITVCNPADRFGNPEIAYIRKPDQSLIIFPVGPGRVSVKLTTSLDVILVWFDNESTTMQFTPFNSNFSCFSNLPPNVLVDNLQDDVAYTFCLLNRFTTTISPFNCAAYYQQSESDSQRLSNENVGMQLVLSFSLLIFLLLMGCMITCCVIRSRLRHLRKKKKHERLDKRASVRSNKYNRTDDMQKKNMN